MEKKNSQKKELIKNNDFVELEFTGYANESVFDSNIPEDLKKISKDAKPQKTIVIVGQKMVVQGLDKELVGKEIGKEYKADVNYKEGFGERKRELVKTIPLRVFTKQKINPHPGATLLLDNALAKIITISGARVITDFNNPLAGKNLKYKFKAKKKVSEKKEKAETFFKHFLKFSPEFEETSEKVIVKGPKVLQNLVESFKEKFKELVGTDLDFKEVEKKEAPNKDSTKKDK